MTDLFVDGASVDVKDSAQTWADVLTDLDPQLDARGRVLTDVVFDRVAEPTYREPPALVRLLSAIARIDVATATPDALLKDCLLESAGSLYQLEQESVGTAALFRNQDVGDAHQRLARITNELGQLMQLVRTLDTSLGVVLQPEGDTNGDLGGLDRFGLLLESLLTSEKSGDYVTVADILDFDLAPFLQAWQARFERLAA